MNASENNSNKTNWLYALMQKTLETSLRKGFYGDISFSVSVQDGAIQDIKKQVSETIRLKAE